MERILGEREHGTDGNNIEILKKENEKNKFQYGLKICDLIASNKNRWKDCNWGYEIKTLSFLD